MGEICSHNPLITVAPLLPQGERHISGAAAEIENASVRPSQCCREDPRGATPPNAVHIERKNVVQKIVARSDRGEHLANSSRG
jgi:hypothetical protein